MRHDQTAFERAESERLAELREMYLAFCDPRNKKPIPWAKVKKKLKGRRHDKTRI